MRTTKGSLEVICGSMFSGKSEELIRRLKRAEIARKNVLVFKPSIDDRHTIEYITSHNGKQLKAVALDNANEIPSYITTETEVVGIDEVQFFSNDIINIICLCIEQGKRVIVAGLDLDFKKVPFGCMPILMAIADSVTKLKAICMVCGKDAHFTQRLVDGHPAKSTDPIVLIGAEDSYLATCRSCHRIDAEPHF